jgi:predicted HicB family RNase H-like nuclease
VITFESSNASRLETEFHKSVEEYLKFCAEMKREAEKTLET